MRSIQFSHAVLAALLALPWAARADDQGAAIQKKLEAEYQLTKVTDDKSDIVTAGSVLVLHKDKVLMIAATSSVNPCMNTYRDGKITPSGACKASEGFKKIRNPLKALNLDKTPSQADSAPSTRNYVSGEKFWVTKIDVRTTGKDHGVVLDFFTDAVSDVRYRGVLTIPFGALIPTPEAALKVVQEVITVAPSDDDKSADKSGDKKPSAPPAGEKAAPAPSQPASTPAVSEAAPPPLEAPPPPPADPVQISEGQTPDQVVAAMGQPLKKFKAGTKEVYTYKDVKITFVNGKVKDIQ